VNAYNAVADFISQQTAYNADTKSASRFTGSALFRSVESEIRKVVTTTASGLSGAYTSLTQIGISTGAFTTEITPTKKLELDETKLTDALKTNQQAVTDLLTAATGPIQTVSTYLENALSDTGILGSGENSAASITGKEIDTIQKQIDGWETRLDARQSQLEKKFAALERNMAKLQAQSAQLTSQLASLNGLFAPPPAS
jgi:flagellar hook-associated protein 2